jgi:hypothetical protein
VPFSPALEKEFIPDPAKIRQDQKLKVLRAPFNARIYKSKFRLDVYLGELYVRSYRVGLGTEGGTPEGVPIPVRDSEGNLSYKKDRSGQVVLSSWTRRRWRRSRC